MPNASGPKFETDASGDLNSRYGVGTIMPLASPIFVKFVTIFFLTNPTHLFDKNRRVMFV